MLKIRRVPWKNKVEWLDVYRKAFETGDVVDKHDALERMDEWIKRGNCPPAVEYTYKFMVAMKEDPHFFPMLPAHSSESHLQLLYATSLLRFINILGEVESIKSLSLNARALKTGLPEWVVSIRHQISHGSALPSLEILRLSVASLVDWLQENYWEVEKKSMGDLVLPDRLNTLKEKFFGLLKIFVFLRSSCDNVETVQQLQNDEMKQAILALNDFQYCAFKSKTSPWDAQDLPGTHLLQEPKKLDRYKIVGLANLVIRSIKMYYDHESPDHLSKIVASLIMEGSYPRGNVKKTWEPLIEALHSKGTLAALINEFIHIIGQKDKSHYKRAAEWTIYLLKSVLKRLKVERKLVKMASSSVPKSKKMRLNLSEKEEHLLSLEGIKHQLSFESSKDGLKVEILPSLFGAIEKANPELKSSLRLKDPKFFTEREIYIFIQKLIANPNEFTEPIGKLLVAMSSILTLETISKLMHLVKLKESDPSINRITNNRVYDYSSLLSRLGSQIHSPAQT